MRPACWLIAANLDRIDHRLQALPGVDRKKKRPFSFTEKMSDNRCSVNYTHLHSQTIPMAGHHVMDEAFDCGTTASTPTTTDEFFKTWANTDITDMAARDLNRPSVITCSIDNEVGETSDSATVKQLMDAI